MPDDAYRPPNQHRPCHDFIALLVVGRLYKHASFHFPLHHSEFHRQRERVCSKSWLFHTQARTGDKGGVLKHGLGELERVVMTVTGLYLSMHPSIFHCTIQSSTASRHVFVPKAGYFTPSLPVSPSSSPSLAWNKDHQVCGGTAQLRKPTAVVRISVKFPASCMT